MPIDARDFQLVPDFTQAGNSIASGINAMIAKRLSEKALNGDQQAYTELASRNPNAANAVGSILQSRQQQEEKAKAAGIAKRQQEQQIAYRIARGYQAATDKAGFLQSAAQNLQSAGMTDLAAHVAEDAQNYLNDPASIDSQYTQGFQALDAIYGEKEKPVSIAAGSSLVDPSTGKVLFEGPQESKPVNVSPGSSLVDPKTGKVVFHAPESPDKEKDVNTFKNASELRKEFINQSKDYSLQNDAIGRIASAAKDPSAAGDLALIFSFMKVQDPGSTVREGEFATAQNAGGVPDRVMAAYNKVLSGERLAPAQRADFVNTANKLFAQSKAQHKKRESEYTRLAKQNQIDPANVVVDFSTYQPDQEVQQQAPQAAIDHLRQNPSLAPAFKAKYGYLPEGM